MFTTQVGQRNWLDSFRTRSAKTISVTGGKGGVGKTSVTLKLAQELARNKQKVLVIDCDFNLSNTQIKLGLPIGNQFIKFAKNELRFEDCINQVLGFDLLAGCNGDIDIFENSNGQFSFEKTIVNLLVEQENNYDVILLDCPAGLGRESLTLNAYSDFRIFVITPDKSSITDSYSLMKILKMKFGVMQNHVIINKVSSDKQFKKLITGLGLTVDTYLQVRLGVLGSLELSDLPVDDFDKVFLGEKNTKYQNSLFHIIKRLADEGVGQNSMNEFLTNQADLSATEIQRY